MVPNNAARIGKKGTSIINFVNLLSLENYTKANKGPNNRYVTEISN